MRLARNGKIEHLIDFLLVENGVKNLSLKLVYALLCSSLLSALVGIQPAYALYTPIIFVDGITNPFPPYYYIFDQAVLLTGKEDIGLLPSAPDPSGTVTFLYNGSPIPGCVAKGIVYYAADFASEQSCFTADLPAGTDMITVQYSGDSYYAGTVAGSEPSFTWTDTEKASTTASIASSL